MNKEPWYTRDFLKILEKIRFGRLSLTSPEGRTYVFSGKEEGPTAQIEIHSWKCLFPILLYRSLGLGETFVQNEWESTSLVDLLTLIAINSSPMEDHTSHLSQLASSLGSLVRPLLSHANFKGDLPQERLKDRFYKLWLDKTMNLSSAIWQKNSQEHCQDHELDLYSAQVRKMDRVLHQMNRKKEKSLEILEIGCGWGGFMEYSSQQGHKIYGLTPYQEEFDYIKNRLHQDPSRRDLGNTEITLGGYSDAKGKFDAVVSLEVYELLGEKHWKPYFQKIADSLKPQGKAVIQGITIHPNRFTHYQKGDDFVRTYIAQGGMLASPPLLHQAAENTALLIEEDSLDISEDYERTIEKWSQNFEREKEAILALGFSPKFERMWRFYLSLCQAGFRAGITKAFQYTFTRK